MVKPGTYKHYKGKLYKVILVAKHTETMEDFVVYQQLYDTYHFWVRPLVIFLQEVEIEGRKIPRFQLIEE